MELINRAFNQKRTANMLLQSGIMGLDWVKPRQRILQTMRDLRASELRDHDAGTYLRPLDDHPASR